MPLCIGGPLDSKLYQSERNAGTFIIKTMAPSQPETHLVVEDHVYSIVELRGVTESHTVYVHETVDDPILELIKGYYPSKKSSA